MGVVIIIEGSIGFVSTPKLLAKAYDINECVNPGFINMHAQGFPIERAYLAQLSGLPPHLPLWGCRRVPGEAYESLPFFQLVHLLARFLANLGSFLRSVPAIRIGNTLYLSDLSQKTLIFSYDSFYLCAIALHMRNSSTSLLSISSPDGSSCIWGIACYFGDFYFPISVPNLLSFL